MRLTKPLIIWTGKQFVTDRRSEVRRPGSFNDRYIGLVYRTERAAKQLQFEVK